MGAIAPSKMPKGVKKARRDDTDFTEYKEGGKVKSKVNAAGNYTKPELRKRIFNSVKAAAIVGTGAGQWSARKAQVMAKRYKAAGGGYK
jgi:putative N-acetylmannosamine-6-phosphate epimerase